MEDLVGMAKDFAVKVPKALEDCAPIKKFKINKERKTEKVTNFQNL